MKKILFLVNHDVVIYNFRYELVEALRKEGHEVVISSPYGERIKDLQELGCKYVETKVSRHGTNPIKDFGLFLKYIKLLRREKPDIVFSYTIKPNIYGGMACEILGVPYVTNITGLGSAVENGGMMQKITVLLYKIAFMRVQKVFFQNLENMQFFIDNKIAVKKHGILPGSGVNLKKFAYEEYPTEEKTEFAFISRIMKEKGADQYLEAAEKIHTKYPNTMFHVCGFCEEAYEERLADLQKRGVIVYHGMVRDVRTVIKDMHCIIHPTYYPEGLSNVLLEASACGRPIITTNRSGCREVIDDGVNGFITEQKSTEDLIEKIEKFLELDYETKKNMGKAGRKKVEKEFDRNIVVKEYMHELVRVHRGGKRNERV